MTGLYSVQRKHRAFYRSGRPVIKIGPKGALGSNEIRAIHSAPSLGQSIAVLKYGSEEVNNGSDKYYKHNGGY